jgi:acetoin utilization deacetylase AcuC-like enzyme
VRVYTHQACLAHDPGPGHPESPARLEALLSALRSAFPALDWQVAPRASRAQLQRVHSPELLARLLDHAPVQSIRLDPDTVLSPTSPEAALRAAGAGIAAVDWSLQAPSRRAFCAVRPPGHHATRDTAMGFCLFNNAAIAAAHALSEHRLERIAVIDFDVHHGNGSQDIFANEPRVQYLSSHQSPLYPGSGREDEIGVGNVRNATLPPGSVGAAFRTIWKETLLPALEAFRPQLLLLSAGFDAHRLDPLADLCLEATDYAWIGAELTAAAERHAQGRLVAFLEGGYSLTALRESSVALLRGLGA